MNENDSACAPVTVVVFGATGDLSQKKLLSALLDLSCKEVIDPAVRIVGVARQSHTNDSFQAFVREVVARKNHGHPKEKVEAFIEKLSYVEGDTSDATTYTRLKEHLDAVDRKRGLCSSTLFYLAVPPALYGTIFQALSDSGLKHPCSDDTWVRIAVEKPFGSDLATARELDQMLGELFLEEQIFRIDHYLGKEVLENIMAFRFSNILFEPVWNKQYIESIHVTLHEEFGVGARGSFYEGVGALRDVGQNHILQMLAFVTMDDPGELSAEAIRREREKVLAALSVPQVEEGGNSIHKGQYQSYRSEMAVGEDSKVETYFRIHTELDLPRWQGVPVYLEGGKKMPDSTIEIVIRFKPVTSCVCTQVEEAAIGGNQLVFQLSPDELIRISFWSKKRGFTMEVEERTFCFDFKDQPGVVRDAYEKILLDAIRGDQTLFTTSKEVEHAWSFITPIVEGWANWEPTSYEDGTTPDIITHN